jgi:hypothetical protein
LSLSRHSIHVHEEAEKLGYEHQLLPAEESEQIHCEVRRHFATSHHRVLWEALGADTSYQNDDGGAKIDSFLQGAPFILLFEEHDDKTVMRFEAGCCLNALLNECYGFVFYLTDANYSYLLCFNDHDSLIAVGDEAEACLDSIYQE